MTSSSVKYAPAVVGKLEVSLAGGEGIGDICLSQLNQLALYELSSKHKSHLPQFRIQLSCIHSVELRWLISLAYKTSSQERH